MQNIDLIESIDPDRVLYGAMSARMLADSIHLATTLGRSDEDLRRRASDLLYVIYYVLTPAVDALRGDDREKAVKHLAVAVLFLEKTDELEIARLCAA